MKDHPMLPKPQPKITTRGGAPAHCHYLIKDTARAMAASLYEKMATISPSFYKDHPDEQRFINAHWQYLIEPARTTLVSMLTGGYPQELKDQIAEAIIADNTLTRGRPERVASRNRTGHTAQAPAKGPGLILPN